MSKITLILVNSPDVDLEQYKSDLDALREEVLKYKYSDELQGKDNDGESTRTNQWFWDHTQFEHHGITLSVINFDSYFVKSFIDSEAFEKVLSDYNLNMDRDVKIDPPLE